MHPPLHNFPAIREFSRCIFTESPLALTINDIAWSSQDNVQPASFPIQVRCYHRKRNVSIVSLCQEKYSFKSHLSCSQDAYLTNGMHFYFSRNTCEVQVVNHSGRCELVLLIILWCSSVFSRVVIALQNLCYCWLNRIVIDTEIFWNFHDVAGAVYGNCIFFCS